MNRRNFIKGVMATAAGGALALVAKERIAASPPQATVLAGESGVIHGGTIAEPLPNIMATAGNGTVWITSTPDGPDNLFATALREPQTFPPYDDWCGMYVDRMVDAMQYAHPQPKSSMRDPIDTIYEEFSQKYGPITFR